jgi:hypothetical protein
MRIYRPLIIVLGLNLILAGCLFFGHNFLQSRQAALQADAATYLSLQQSSDKSFQLERLLAATAGERQNLHAQFVTRDSLVSFLENLDEWGRQTGVSLRVNGVSETEPIVLEMRAVGTFKQVFQLLQLIELMPYQAKINRISLNHVAEEGKTSAWSLELSVQFLQAKS